MKISSVLLALTVASGVTARPLERSSTLQPRGGRPGIVEFFNNVDCTDKPTWTHKLYPASPESVHGIPHVSGGQDTWSARFTDTGDLREWGLEGYSSGVERRNLNQCRMRGKAEAGLTAFGW